MKITADENRVGRARARLARSLGFVCALMLACMSGSGQPRAGDLQRLAENDREGAPVMDQSKPAESEPGGTRPTNPAPEPARPSPEAQKQGAKAALPPAPAEKIAPPIKDR